MTITVLRRFVLTLALCAACGPSDPDYSHTAFVCDSTSSAPGQCPAEQACDNGRCRRDAQGRFDGVVCGNTTCLTNDLQCCAGDGEHPRCIPASEVCSGVGALCDGEADCAKADHCCDLGGITACNTDCATVVCRTNADCPALRGNCCGVGSALPWGTCQAASC